MIAEYHLGSVLMAPFVVYAAVAIVPYGVLRAILGRIGALGAVWHPALFDLSLYVAILSLLVVFA